MLANDLLSQAFVDHREVDIWWLWLARTPSTPRAWLPGLVSFRNALEYDYFKQMIAGERLRFRKHPLTKSYLMKSYLKKSYLWTLRHLVRVIRKQYHKKTCFKKMLRKYDYFNKICSGTGKGAGCPTCRQQWRIKLCSTLTMTLDNKMTDIRAYLIFVFFFTQPQFEAWKFYT